MKIRVGDKVKVISGKDKGKEGTVTKTIKANNRIIVGGLNISKKHTKPDGKNNPGGIVEIELPIDVSNVKKVDSDVKKKSTKTKK